MEGNHDYILLLDRKVCIARGKEERTSRVMLWNCRLLSLLFRHQLLAISSSQLPRTHIWAYNTSIAINHSSIKTISRTGSTNVAETRFHAVSFMKTAARTKNSTSIFTTDVCSKKLWGGRRQNIFYIPLCLVLKFSPGIPVAVATFKVVKWLRRLGEKMYIPYVPA